MMSWVGQSSQVVTTGFNSQNGCEMHLRDLRNISTPVASLSLPSCHNTVIPMCSSDLVYLAEKGTNAFYVVQPKMLVSSVTTNPLSPPSSNLVSLPLSTSTKQMILLNSSGSYHPVGEVSRFIRLQENDQIEALSLTSNSSSILMGSYGTKTRITLKNWMNGDTLTNSVTSSQSHFKQPHLSKEIINQYNDTYKPKSPSSPLSSSTPIFSFNSSMGSSPSPTLSPVRPVSPSSQPASPNRSGVSSLSSTVRSSPPCLCPPSFSTANSSLSRSSQSPPVLDFSGQNKPPSIKKENSTIITPSINKSLNIKDVSDELKVIHHTDIPRIERKVDDLEEIIRRQGEQIDVSIQL